MSQVPKRAASKKKTIAAASTPLVSRLVAAPLLSAPDDTRAKVAAWLAEVARTAAGRGLKDLLARSREARAVIEGLADGSPYLWENASADPERLHALLQADPDEHLAELLSQTAAALADAAAEQEAMRLLRRMRAQAA